MSPKDPRERDTVEVGSEERGLHLAELCDHQYWPSSMEGSPTLSLGLKMLPWVKCLPLPDTPPKRFTLYLKPSEKQVVIPIFQESRRSERFKELPLFTQRARNRYNSRPELLMKPWGLPERSWGLRWCVNFRAPGEALSHAFIHSINNYSTTMFQTVLWGRGEEMEGRGQVRVGRDL